MSRVKSAIKAIALTPWFVRTSWSYITTGSYKSKVEFFTGLIPSWVRFTILEYKGNRKND